MPIYKQDSRSLMELLPVLSLAALLRLYLGSISQENKQHYKC